MRKYPDTPLQRMGFLFVQGWKLAPKHMAISAAEIVFSFLLVVQVWLIEWITREILERSPIQALTAGVVLAVLTGMSTTLAAAGTNARLYVVDVFNNHSDAATLDSMAGATSLEDFENSARQKSLALVNQRRGDVGRGLNSWFVALSNLASFASIVVAAWVISPWLLIPVVLSLGQAAIGFVAQSRIERSADSEASKLARAHQLIDCLTMGRGADELRLLGAQQLYSKHIVKHAREWVNPQRRALVQSFMLSCSGLVLVLAGLGLAGFMMLHYGAYGVPEIAALLFLTPRIIGGADMAFYTAASLHSTDMAVRRWVDSLVTPHAMEAELPQESSGKGCELAAGDRYDVLIDDVCYAFANGHEHAVKTALRHVSIQIPAGTTAAIVGPNGSGKSTLAQIIAGVRVPQSGAVHVATGRDIRYVPQDPKFFTGTLSENIELDNPPVVSKDALALMASRSMQDLTVKKNLRPNNASEQDEFSDLSGGQWKRVALARETHHSDSDVIVVDEPESELDTQGLSELRRWLLTTPCGEKEIRIIVTHSMDTAQKCDWIVMLDDGEVRYCGPQEKAPPLIR